MITQIISAAIAALAPLGLIATSGHCRPPGSVRTR